MNRLNRILDFITNVISAQLSGWLIFIMSTIVMIEVISRYAVRQPLMVADELSGYCLVIITFMGLAYTWKERGHINIKVLTDRLPAKATRWVRVVATGLITAFLPLLIKGTIDVTSFLYKNDTRGFSNMRMQVVWFEMFIVIGLILFFITVFIDFIRQIRLAAKDGETSE